jgi:uncharacterized membrane protein (Fun14 family)
MSADVFTSIPATIGGGFIGGLFLGFALKKIVKLFVGLAYLQYQQIAYFDWDKIERMNTATLGNVTKQIFSNPDTSSFAFANLGIPLTSGMSAGICSWFYEGISKSWIMTMFLQEISEQSSVLLIKE